MRLAVAGHSLVADRQAMFFDYVNDSICPVLQVYPEEWSREHRNGGYHLRGRPTMAEFTWPPEALSDIREFKPDWLYIQQEFWSASTWQLMSFSKDEGMKCAVFVWENLRPYTPYEMKWVERADFIVCGNMDAWDLLGEGPKHRALLPQVGVDTDLFRPNALHKDVDFLFTGRPVPEKGVHVLRRAIEGQPWTLLTTQDLPWCPYKAMPLRYNRAYTHVAPSIDSPTWKEQNAPYANLEALACGLTVATSRSQAILDYLSGCEAAWFADQKDARSLRTAMTGARWGANDPALTRLGRDYILARYSTDAVAKKLIAALERC